MTNAKAHYRKLHRIPETSGREYQTSEYISGVLQGCGYDVRRIGQTSVFTDLVTDTALPWILLRADMDALPVMEQTGLPFASEHEGFMHACGHDAHCAMLLDAAVELRNFHLPHNVRFLFQSAEETTQGAWEAVQAGVIPDHLAACFAFHVWPGVPYGAVATRAGALMASSDVYRVRTVGRSAHCAQSYNGADALQTVVQIASQLPVIRSRAKDDRTLLFCGSIHSGNSHNIVPDEASLYGTLRTFSKEDRKNLKRGLEAAAAEASREFGTRSVVEWDVGSPVIDNSPEIIRILGDLIPGLLEDYPATLAAEDFAYYQQYAPGVMLWLGTGDTPPLHNGSFYVPQELLEIGVERWLEIARFDWKSIW